MPASRNGQEPCPRQFHLQYFSKVCLFFLMWTVFKVFIEFVTILLLFYVLWDLSYRPWFEPAHPALEGEVLTTGPPGKFLTKLPNI